MAVANYSDIFQQKMNDLFHGYKFICTYMDSILVLTKGDWTYHVHNLELTLNKMKEKRLKDNIIWSFQNEIFRILGHTLWSKTPQ